MDNLEGAIHYIPFSFNDLVNRIFESPSGQIWMTSAFGVYYFDSKNEELRAFDSRHGMAFARIGRFGQMMEDGMLLTSNGEQAFNIINTNEIKENSTPPKLYITAVYPLYQRDRPFEIEPGKVLTLQHHQKDIAIEYQGLHYEQPAEVRYSYRLNGRDEAWIDLEHQRIIRLPGLPKGNYTFLLKAANPDGYETPEPLQLELRVLPPWWRSTWAYGLYLLLFTSAIISLYRIQRQRWKMKLQMEYNEQENQRLKEVNELKSRLYTNITHEFRTPLTLILGMTEQVQKAPDRWFKEGMSMIRENGQALLKLINQMLDMTKIQTGAVKLNLIQADVATLLKETFEPFQSTANNNSHQQNLELQLHFDELYMDTDPHIFEQIINNLLSNAVKFTPSEGTIILEAFHSKAQNALVVRVKDTGIGIATQDLPKVFDRFFQADASSTRKYGGTGIGLALTKEWVQLLNGEINVESRMNEGATFTISLPVTNLAIIATPHQLKEIPKEAAEYGGRPAKGRPSQNELPCLLIVEDHPSFIRYLKSILEDHYQVFEATDGQKGIDLALQLIPDLIITDVMMPEKDGFQLCDALKKDERTNHIPIIMLTAKADVSSRIRGLEKGADAYLPKPFEETELLVRLQKLLEIRKRLQEKYQKSLPLSGSPADNMLIADPLLEKVHNCIETNMSDDFFDVHVLSQKVGLDRTQLYRKVKALTGKPPVEIIRAVKMQHARRLLEESERNISEIAFALGFKDPAYFSRVFQREFGKPPKDFRKKQVN